MQTYSTTHFPIDFVVISLYPKGHFTIYLYKHFPSQSFQTKNYISTLLW